MSEIGEEARRAEPVDVIVIGGGPVGLACAIEAERKGLSARVIEKGALVNSLLSGPDGALLDG